MAVNFNSVTDITIPEGNVTKIEDSNGNILWSKTSTFDLLATCVNKGWRSTTNNITGNGTDPNWEYGDPVSTEGYSTISCSIYGYTTVASIMYYNSSMGILSYITDSANVSLTNSPIPSGAKYVAVCCRNKSSWADQFCFME